MYSTCKRYRDDMSIEITRREIERHGHVVSVCSNCNSQFGHSLEISQSRIQKEQDSQRARNPTACAF